MGTPPLRVLVVEDNADAGETLAELLQAWSCTARVAGDGAAGLDAALDWRPDVVLLDIGLPKLTGWRVAAELRRAGGDYRPLIVAVTGYGADADRARSQWAGVDEHLTKPVDADALHGLIERRRSELSVAG